MQEAIDKVIRAGKHAASRHRIGPPPPNYVVVSPKQPRTAQFRGEPSHNAMMTARRKMKVENPRHRVFLDKPGIMVDLEFLLRVLREIKNAQPLDTPKRGGKLDTGPYMRAVELLIQAAEPLRTGTWSKAAKIIAGDLLGAGNHSEEARDKALEQASMNTRRLDHLRKRLGLQDLV